MRRVDYVAYFVVVGMGLVGVEGDLSVVFVGEGGVPGCVAVVWLASESKLGLCKASSVVDDRVVVCRLGATEGLVEAGILCAGCERRRRTGEKRNRRCVQRGRP